MASAVARTRSDWLPPTSGSRMGGWATSAPATMPGTGSGSRRRRLRPEGVDGVAIAPRCLGGGIGEIRAARGKQNRPRNGDDHAAAIGSHRCRHRGTELSALGTDAWNEQEPITGNLAHVAQFRGRRRSHHEGDVVVMIPANAGPRDVTIERLAVAAQMLKFRGAGVRRPANDEDLFLFVREEGR